MSPPQNSKPPTKKKNTQKLQSQKISEENDNFSNSDEQKNNQKESILASRINQTKLNTKPIDVLLEIGTCFQKILKKSIYEQVPTQSSETKNFKIPNVTDVSRIMIFPDIASRKMKIIFSIQNPTIRSSFSNENNSSQVLKNGAQAFTSKLDSGNNSKILLSKSNKIQSTGDNSNASITEKINKRFAELFSQTRIGKFVFLNHFLKKLDKISTEIYNETSSFPKIDFLTNTFEMVKNKIPEFKCKSADFFEKYQLLVSKFKMKTEKYPSIPLQPRLFNEISDYKSIFCDSNDAELKSKYCADKLLKSDSKPTCFNCCCFSSSKHKPGFAEFDSIKGIMISNCIDKQKSVECDQNCGCGVDCVNRQVQTKNYKKLGKEVQVQIAWGIDLFTNLNIINFIPMKRKNHEKNWGQSREQHENVLKEIINQLSLKKTEGWNLMLTFQDLYDTYRQKIKETEDLLSPDQSNSDFDTLSRRSMGENIKDYSMDTPINKSQSYPSEIEAQSNQKEHNFENERLAGIKFGKNEQENPGFEIDNFNFLKDEIQRDANSQNINLYKERKSVYKCLFHYSMITQIRHLLRVHTKGIGVFNISKNAIAKNSLITVYFGEIYPPWYWYAKQDVIKSFLARVKRTSNKELVKYKNNYVMDFYNIMLDKLSTEEKGRELVFVDPIFNGNYASRLSHSCKPNCLTFPVSSKGSYSVGLYAIDTIEPNEELTFDYCSFTESQKEYEESVCLCGTQICRGHYLHFYKKQSKTFIEEMKQKNGDRFLLDKKEEPFFAFNYILLFQLSEVFTMEDKQRLKELKLGENLFKFSPKWLKKWALILMQMIKEERENLYEELKNTKEGIIVSKEIKQEIEDLHYQRVHALIVAIDKIQNFLSHSNTNYETEKQPKKEIISNVAYDFLKSKDCGNYMKNSIQKQNQIRYKECPKPVSLAPNYLIIEYLSSIVTFLSLGLCENRFDEENHVFLCQYLLVFISEPIEKESKKLHVRSQNFINNDPKETEYEKINYYSSSRSKSKRIRPKSKDHIFECPTEENRQTQTLKKESQNDGYFSFKKSKFNESNFKKQTEDLFFEEENSPIFNRIFESSFGKSNVSKNEIVKNCKTRIIFAFETLILRLFGNHFEDKLCVQKLLAKNENEYLSLEKIKIILLKYLLLRISEKYLQRNQNNHDRVIGCAAYFYAVTQYHFQYHLYHPLKTNVNIRECDLTNPKKLFEKTKHTKTTNCKTRKNHIR